MIINIKGNYLKKSPQIETIIDKRKTVIILDTCADYNFIAETCYEIII